MNLLLHIAYIETVGIEAVTSRIEDRNRAQKPRRLRRSAARTLRRWADRVEPAVTAPAGC